MSDIMKKVISLGIGITAVSREKAQQFVDEMVKKGELAQSESKDTVNRLIERGEEQQSEFKRMVQEQVKKILDGLDIATKQDLKDLEKRLQTTNSPSNLPTQPPIL